MEGIITGLLLALGALGAKKLLTKFLGRELEKIFDFVFSIIAIVTGMQISNLQVPFLLTFILMYLGLDGLLDLVFPDLFY